MDWVTSIPLLVAVLALLGTFYTANVTRGKLDKTEAVTLEGRFKDFEAGQKLIQQDVDYIKENMITSDQKACLLILEERVNTILAGLGTFIPQALKNPKHLDPLLDKLSETAAEEGWDAVIDHVKDLDEDKRTTLLSYLDKISKDQRYKPEKRNGAFLYLGVLRIELARVGVPCIPA